MTQPNFFPSNYNAVKAALPKKAGNFLKLRDGDSIRLRILPRTFLTGFVWWDKTQKPHRSKELPSLDTISSQISGDLRVFNAYIIWNYDANKIQIWEITQATIKDRLEELATGQWGSPFNYDIIAARTGSGQQDTKYTIDPCPPSQTKFKEPPGWRGVNLDALLNNEDPFGDSAQPESMDLYSVLE